MLILLVAKLAFGIFVVEYYFNGKSDELVDYLMERPKMLLLYFFYWYLFGVILLFPPNMILITMSFALTHIWGPMNGIIIAIGFNFVCQHVAFLAAFFVGRFALHSFIYERVIRSQKFFILNRAVTKHGAWISFLVRLSCLVPNPIINYALSVTDISVSQFVLGNMSILPVSLLFVYAGTSAATLHDSYKNGANGWLPVHQVWLLVIGLLILFGILYYVIVVVKRELDEIEDEYQDQVIDEMVEGV